MLNFDKWIQWIALVTGLIGTIGVGWLQYSASTESDKVKVDIEMIGLAKTFLTDPQSSPSLKYWAVDVLGIWQKVPLSPERKKKIVEELQLEPTKSLSSISEAMDLNKKLTSDPLWENAGDTWKILGGYDEQPPNGKQPSPFEPMPIPAPDSDNQMQPQPGTGKNSPETLEQP